jgi:DNA polymerase (family 10)
MKLEDAVREAAWVVSKFDHFCERVMVVGSVRRRRPEVNDIDIVTMPKHPRDGNWDEMARALRHAHRMLQIKKGPKLMTFAHYAEVPDLLRPRDPDYTVDIYHAAPEIWGILVLVRTGSKEHNVKLCSLALSKGMKLSAAEGILKPLESFPSMIKVVASRTEEEIFAALGIPFVKPEDREVRA